MPRRTPRIFGYAIDIQGEGCYALIPPSKVEGKDYRIIKDLPIAEIEDVVSLLTERLPRLPKRGAGIGEFKRKINLSQIIQRYVKKSREGKGYWQANCPFHDDKHPSLTVYSDHFFCFGCQAHGDCIDFVRMIEKTDFLGARKLEEITGVQFLRGKIERGQKDKPSPAEVADLLLDAYTFKTFSDSEEVLVYQHGVYRLAESLIKAETERLMKDLDLLRHCTGHFVCEVIGHIQRRTFIDRREANPPLNLLNLNNGILDLETLELKPHTPELVFTGKLPVNFEPGAKCPKIGKFLSEILHSEDIQVMIRAIGFCLYREYFIRKVIVLVGDGANGKSTLLRLITRFLGHENVSNVPLQELDTNRFASAELFGKLANIYADLPERAGAPLGYSRC